MSLLKSKELFSQVGYPVRVDRVNRRTLMKTEMHRHEFFEMLFVVEGSLINRFQFDQIGMQAGDLLILKPYTLHVLDEKQEQARRCAYCCSFLPQIVDSSIQSIDELMCSDSPNRFYFQFISSFSEENVFAIRIQMKPEIQGELLRCFEQLHVCSNVDTESAQAEARSIFLQLMLLISKQSVEEVRFSERISDGVSGTISRYYPGLRKALSYIHDHFSEPIKLDQMAQLTGASETYFCRLFKHETGMTFLNYLNGLRIEQACQLLRDSNESASAICYQVGFNDYTHFGRQFRKNMGISPAAYRKKNHRMLRLSLAENEIETSGSE